MKRWLYGQWYDSDDHEYLTFLEIDNEYHFTHWNDDEWQVLPARSLTEVHSKETIRFHIELKY